ncbi:FAD/NAD(P)-binding domain-containing protein [Stipitochalara longipes BDJ]|nr:FAD/NAD(P)-binding domain-containing protein [Stipitochalara longipes BDJ]
MSIHLIVIGAGLAGLAAAISTKVANPEHEVTILESVKELAEIGAGLQLTPNATRLFKPWGIYDRLVPKATFPKSLLVRRFDGTKILANEPAFQDQIASRYPAPFWGMHRVDLQRAMAARCEELGVVLKLNSKVIHVDFINAEVTIEGWETVKGDVVLCTDGLWSSTRAQFLGKPSPAILTGDLAYRIVINTKDLTGPDAPELKKFIEDEMVNFWVGPGTHVVAYTMRAGSVYNIVLLCPDNLPPSVTKTEGDLNEMKSLFQGWDPILRKFLDQVKGVAKWKLMWLDTLPEWANKQGTFLMAGDCCHPMLPYLAQGANSSLEDGAVVGYLLGKVAAEKKGEQLPKVAALYQKLRKDRGETIQRETFKQREDFHMPDGPEQEKRDELMTGMLGGEVKADFPSRWTCPRVQRWLYGYDAYKEVEEGFKAYPF